MSFVLIMFIYSSCADKSAFVQPTIEVTGYELVGLPGEYANINVDILVTNNDTRGASILDASYQVDIDGFLSEVENETIGKDILVDSVLALTLPITLKTVDAIQLLKKLDAGEKLPYHVTGTFHVDQKFLKKFDLPIDVTGTADVKVGFEDFYEQPDVIVDSFNVDYTANGTPIPSSYTFNIDVNTRVVNNDDRNVEIDEVEYTPTIEGKVTEKHYYSNAYAQNLTIDGLDTVILVLPVTMTMNLTEGAAFIQKLADGTVDYIIEGTFHAIKVDGTASDFFLPLYDTGSVPVTVTEN